MAKKYEGFSSVETAINPRADLSIQERKECEEKIKLENMLIDTGYNRVLQKVKILRQVSQSNCVRYKKWKSQNGILTF